MAQGKACSAWQARRVAHVHMPCACDARQPVRPNVPHWLGLCTVCPPALPSPPPPLPHVPQNENKDRFQPEDTGPSAADRKIRLQWTPWLEEPAEKLLAAFKNEE